MNKKNDLGNFLHLLHGETKDTSETTDSNIVPLYKDLDQGGWTYVVFNLPLDGGIGNVVMDDDEDVARRTYADMAKCGLDRLVMLVQMSRRLSERLYPMNDIRSITEMVGSFRSERKILLCNKNL